MHEAQTSEKACFVTLTYNPENLPKDLSVDMQAWQKFAKRLRKKTGPFRFLMCGEYGDQLQRPHYHALLFGVDFSFDRKFWKSEGDYNLYTSETLEDAWPFGFSSIGEITFESAAYVARYTMKKQGADYLEKGKWIPNPKYVRSAQGKIWSVSPEISSCSRGYGLGKDWFLRWWSDVYPADVCIISGRKLRPPKIYDEWAKSIDGIDMEAIKEKRVEKAQERPLSNEDLKAVEKCLEARFNLKSLKQSI